MFAIIQCWREELMVFVEELEVSSCHSLGEPFSVFLSAPASVTSCIKDNNAIKVGT